MVDSATKSKIIKLRKNGQSMETISRNLGISKSTVSRILCKIPLDKRTREILAMRKAAAQRRGLQKIIDNRNAIKKNLAINSQKIVSSLNISDTNIQKLICSVLYWGEGGKTDNYVSFINSDPTMISTFLKLLRLAFNIDESKLRAIIHLHEYHSEPEIKKYWSTVTKIPIEQFTKSFIKKHSAINIKENYKGTIKIKYFDYKIALELKYIYNSISVS